MAQPRPPAEWQPPMNDAWTGASDDADPRSPLAGVRTVILVLAGEHAWLAGQR